MRSSKVPVLLALGVASSLLTLTACGGRDDTSSAGASPSVAASATPSGPASPSKAPSKIAASDNLDAVKITGAYGKEPKVTVKSPWAIDKTRTEVLESSDGGAVVKDGQTVEVNYFGVNGRTGEKFDDSFSRGESVAFPLDQIVPGLKKGLVGQKQGSRVAVAISGADGYDAAGGSAEVGIEVGDTLIFVVDLIAVQLEGPDGAAVTPKGGLPTVSEGKGTPKVTVGKSDAPTTLQVQPLIKGKGAKVAAADTITFDYTWVSFSDGKVLEESYTTKPASYALAGLLPGMAKGLLDQTVGSRVLLVIPPAEGYPAGNATPKIGPDETLVMVVDILFTQAGQ